MKTMKHRAPLATGLLTAMMLGLAMPPAYAQDTAGEDEATPELETKAPTNNSLFSGVVAMPQVHDKEGGVVQAGAIGNLTNYKHTSGAQLVAETWIGPSTLSLDLSFGGRTPWFGPNENVQFRLTGMGDLSPASQTAAYTAFAEGQFGKRVIVRAGAIGQSPRADLERMLGGFGGVNVTAPHVTVDADGWGSTKHAGVRGYVAVHGQERGLFVGAGGRLQLDLEDAVEDGTINMIAGWVNQGGPGIYTRTSVDVLNGSASGQMLASPSSAFDLRQFRFKNHVFNRTQVRGLATGPVIDGWAPFDADYGNNVTVAVNWQGSEDVTTVGAKVYGKPIPGVFVGGGLSGTHTRSIEGPASFDPVISLDGYVDLSRVEPSGRIPLDAWVSLDINARTGVATPTIYVGTAGAW